MTAVADEPQFWPCCVVNMTENHIGRQRGRKEVESATSQLIEQLIARLLVAAAMAAVLMFIVMAGVGSVRDLRSK